MMEFPFVAEVYLDGGGVQAEAIDLGGSGDSAVEGEVSVDAVAYDGEASGGGLDP